MPGAVPRLRETQQHARCFVHLELVQQVQVLLLARAHEPQQPVQRGAQHRLGPHLRRVGRRREAEVALLQPLAGALQQCDSVL
jgi:hypothetical protein